MSKRRWSVTIPVGAHAYVEVEAETKEEAIQTAMDKVTWHDVETWEYLDKVNAGNVCYFPAPWSIEAEDLGDAEESR